MHQLAGAKEKLQLLQLAFCAIQNEHSVTGAKLKKKKHKERGSNAEVNPFRKR